MRSPTLSLLLINASLIAACNASLSGGVDIDASSDFDAGTLADGAPIPRDGAVDGNTPTDMPPRLPGANDPPVAHDDFFFTHVDTALVLGELIANDEDADGHALSISANSAPAHGSLSPSGAGAFMYTPTSGFYGEDSFTYTVDDGNGGTALGTVYVYTARTIYYVSSEGNDSNAGTSPSTAWQSAARVQTANDAMTFSPGDAVLFRRGDRFGITQTLSIWNQGEAGRPIVLGAYGSGAQPIITGSREVGGWTPYMSNIWQADVTGPVEHLFVNGQHQTLARYPNSGFLRVESGTLTTMNDPDLTQPDGYFNGATMRIRSINWLYDVRTITNYTTGNLTWAENLSNNLANDDWGYFLDNKLVLLDAAGEYYFDSATNKLYLWATGDADPNTLHIEATQHVDNGMASANAGIALTRPHQRIVDITIEHFTDVALNISYMVQDIAARGCTLRQSYIGLRSYTMELTVEDNEVYETYGTAIQIGGDNILVQRNYVHDIAMLPGFGEQNWGYFGIRLSGNNNVIRRNVVEDVGYIGITFGGAHPSVGVWDLDEGTLVEENVVRRTCAVLNDGAAIAFDNTDGLIIRRNLVFDTIGNLDSQKTRASWILTDRFAPGIYFGDKNLQNVTVEANVSAGNTNGIHMDHTTRNRGNVLRDNVLYNNDRQITMSDASNGYEPPPEGPCVMNTGDTVTGNLLFGINDEQDLLYTLEYRCPNAVNWGTFDNNRYYSTTRTDVVVRERAMAAITDHFTLAQWQAASGQDSASTTFTLPWTPAPGRDVEFYENPYPSDRVIAFTGPRMKLDGTSVTSPQVVAPYTVLILLP